MKNENTEGLSLSKQRKLQRQAEIAAKKRSKLITTICLVLVAVAIVGAVGYFSATAIIRKAKSVAINSNYSQNLNDDGTVKNINVADYITIPSYDKIDVKYSELEYSDEKVEEDIQSVLTENIYLDKDEKLVAAKDDTANIDCTGTVDGEELSAATKTGYDIKLGSGDFLEDFENAIIGHNPGDKFTVEVTFPEDYSKNTNLKGKTVKFEVTLNGMKITPEFTDEFVKEKLSDYASTTEEYRQYLKDTNYDTNLTSFVQSYLLDNSEITTYPKAYWKQVKGNYKSDEYAYYEYLTTMYNAYYGITVYDSFDKYLSSNYEMTEEEFDASLDEKALNRLKYALGCQLIAEKEGITATIDDVRKDYIDGGNKEEDFETRLESYGTGYLVQQYICDQVILLLRDRVVVSEE